MTRRTNRRPWISNSFGHKNTIAPARYTYIIVFTNGSSITKNDRSTHREQTSWIELHLHKSTSLLLAGWIWTTSHLSESPLIKQHGKRLDSRPACGRGSAAAPSVGHRAPCRAAWPRPGAHTSRTYALPCPCCLAPARTAARWWWARWWWASGWCSSTFRLIFQRL
jgi:hypothetical protein